jgi:adenine C2-methylase RlmN of 23S rRNA A2503 and tRNA A37
MSDKINLLDLSINELTSLIVEAGYEKYRAEQVYTWLYKGIKDIDSMTNIPKDMRSALKEKAEIRLPLMHTKLESKLDETAKYIFELHDGHIVESVLMKYKYGYSACISSQVGCRMGCRFCASTGAGFMRNLTSGEMIGQILSMQNDLASREQGSLELKRQDNLESKRPDSLKSMKQDSLKSMRQEDLTVKKQEILTTREQDKLASKDGHTVNNHNQEDGKIGNIVVMGIGEPLDNYNNIVIFLKNANEPKGLNISYRRITISTCGLVPEILRLADEKIPVNLSISLHAPNDEIRDKIMPVNKRYSIDKIIEACKIYTRTTNRRITFEYAMIENMNDSRKHALELGRLLKGLLCHVNLIPVNFVEGTGFKRTGRKQMELFKSVLESVGIQTTIRRELGADIDAACGQLRRKMVTRLHTEGTD